MKTLLFLALTATIAASGLLASTALTTTDTIPPISVSDPALVQRTMKAFGSEQEMVRYFRAFAEKNRAIYEKQKSVVCVVRYRRRDRLQLPARGHRSRIV